MPAFILRFYYRHRQIRKVRKGLEAVGRADAWTVWISIDHLIRWSSFPEVEDVYRDAHRRNMLAQFALIGWIVITVFGVVASALKALFGI